jgi:branched-chain amino acid transport system permease protein
MLGGILTWTFTVLAGLPLLASMALALATCAVVGWLMERGVYFRLFDADHVIVLIATIGMSMVLKDGATKIWGSETMIFPVLFTGTWTVGDIVVRTHFVFIIGSAVVLIAAFHTLIAHTRVGLALRAVAENRRVAAMMGVRVVRMLALAFGISYLLGAAAGALIGPIHYVATTGGTTMMIKGIAAAVLGGFGSLPGALVGGIAIGLVEAMAAGFISSAFKDVIVFATFIAVLLVRPTGLLGERPAGVSEP